jgi:uncharacterized protein (TIGR00369 family)
MDLANAEKALAAQPFSVLIGARVTHFADGVAELAVPLGERLHQQHGAAHGGLLSYAADNAITFAAGSVVGDSVLTVEMKINYLRAARGEEIRARAEVVHAGSSLVVACCEITDWTGDERRLCAIAQGTIAHR